MTCVCFQILGSQPAAYGLNKGNKKLGVAGLAWGPTADRDPNLDWMQICLLSIQGGFEPWVTLARLPDLCMSVS